MYANMYEYSWDVVREQMAEKLAEADHLRLVREASRAVFGSRTSLYRRMVSRLTGTLERAPSDEATCTESVPGKPSFA